MALKKKLFGSMKADGVDINNISNTQSETTKAIISGDYQKEYEKLQLQRQQEKLQKEQQEQLKKQQEEAIKKTQQAMEKQKSSSNSMSNMNMSKKTLAQQQTTNNVDYKKVAQQLLTQDTQGGINVSGKGITNTGGTVTSDLANKIVSKEDFEKQYNEKQQKKQEDWKAKNGDNSNPSSGDKLKKSAEYIANTNKLKSVLEESGADVPYWVLQTLGNVGNAQEDVYGVGGNLFEGAKLGGLNSIDYINKATNYNVKNSAINTAPILDVNGNWVDHDKAMQELTDAYITDDSPLKMLSGEASEFKNQTETMLSTEKQEASEKIQKNTEKTNNVVSKKLSELAPSVGQMVPGMVGGPGGAVYMTTSAGGSYYDDAISRGMNEDEAMEYSTIMGIVEGATESIQVGKTINLGKKLAGKSVSNTTRSALADFGLDVLDNFVQESLTEVISEGTAQMVGGEESADWDNIGQRMLQSGIDGALVAVIVNGASAGVGSAQSLKTKMANGEQVTQEELKQVVEDVQKSGKVDVESIAKEEFQAQVDKIKEEINQTTTEEDIAPVNRKQTIQDDIAPVNQVIQNNEQIEGLQNAIQEKQNQLKGSEDERAKQIINESINQLQTELDEEISKSTTQTQEVEQQKENYKYETSDNKKIDTFRQDVIKYLDNSDKTQNLVNTVEKVISDKDYSIRLNDTITNKDGKSVNAQIKTLEDGTTEITINPNANNVAEFLLTHEITHSIETTEMKNLVMDYASKNSEFNKSLETLKEAYKTEEVSDEVLADVSAQLFGNQEFINELSTKKPNVFRRIYNKIIELANKMTGNSKESLFIKDLKNKWQEAYSNNSKNIDETKYHISENFESEIDKALNNELPSNTQVKARDYTPEILVKNGVEDLPMLITQKHIRSIVYTSQEAQNLNLPMENTNYHGLGKEQLVKAIDSLDSPDAIYQHANGKYSNKNYVVITSIKDSNGNNIIVPIQINGKGNYNNLIIDENQIKTVYGKNNIEEYIKNNNLKEIYKKEELDFNERVQFPDIANSSKSNIQQDNQKVNTRYSENPDIPQWQQWLEENFKSRGTRTKFEDILAPVQKKVQEEVKNTVQDIIAPIRDDIQNISRQINNIVDEIAPIKKKDIKYNNEKANLNISNENPQISNVNSEEQDKIVSKIKELYKQEYIAKQSAQKMNKNIKLTQEEQGIVRSLLDNNITVKDIPVRFEDSRAKIIQKYQSDKELYEIRKQIKQHQKASKEVYNNMAQEIINHKGKIKDKSRGILYRRETATRNIQDIVKDKELANKINSTYFKPVQQNEAQRIRYINENAKKIEELDIDTKTKYEYTNRIINKDGEYEYKDIKINEADIAGLYLENKIGDVFFKNNGIDKTRIKKIADTFKSILDDGVNKMETEFIKAGYGPIGRIENYFPHFYETKPDGLIGKIANFIGIRTKMQNLPTEIAGITDTFKPGKAWNANTLHREGEITDIDALKAMENYINGASDVICHTDDIQKLRALERNIRKSYSDEETLKTIENIKNSSELTEVEKEEAISNKLKDVKTELPNFVTWLNEYTNILANKKVKSDRSMEDNWGRSTYVTMQDIESKIASNIVGGNLSVSLTNFAPLAQAMGTTKVGNVLIGMIETVKNDINTIIGSDDGFADASDFLTRRRGAKTIHKQSKSERVSGILGKPMEIIDNFTSEAIVRAKYRENIQNGMDEFSALKNADEYSANLMADRAKGSQPTLFESKNPVNKLITMFQVEPNNMISNYTKDWKNYDGNKLFAVTKLAIASYGFNTILKAIRGGSDILPDPINLVSNLIKMFTSDDDKEREKAQEGVISSLTGSLPFGSTAVIVANALGIDVPESIQDSGKMPVANAIPSIGKIIKGVQSDSEEYRNQELSKELMKPLLYLGLPTGGAQINKTTQGIISYLNKESYKYNSKGEKQLQFTVDEDASNLIRSIIFGKYSIKEAQEYMDSGYKTIDGDDIDELYALRMNSTEYRNYKAVLSDWNKLYSEKRKIEKSETLTLKEKSNQINNLEIQIKDIEQNKLSNYDHIKLNSNYLKIGKTEYYKDIKGYWTKVSDELEIDLKELKLNDIQKNKYFKAKYVLDSISDKYEKKTKNIPIINEDSDEYKEAKEKISAKKKEDIVDALKNSALNDKTKVYLYKKYYNTDTIDNMVTAKINIDDYLTYTTKEFIADKDSKGKTIKDSRKNKVISYVNKLDLTLAQKAILIKTTNTFEFNDYNKQIVQYVENLGLSQSEKKKLYKSLDMTLNNNGTVSWK